MICMLSYNAVIQYDGGEIYRKKKAGENIRGNRRIYKNQHIIGLKPCSFRSNYDGSKRGSENIGF